MGLSSAHLRTQTHKHLTLFSHAPGSLCSFERRVQAARHRLSVHSPGTVQLVSLDYRRANCAPARCLVAVKAHMSQLTQFDTVEAD